MVRLVAFARGSETAAHVLAGLAILLFAYDLYMAFTGRSSVAFVTAFFTANALLSNVPNLVLGIVLVPFAVFLNFAVPKWLRSRVSG